MPDRKKLALDGGTPVRNSAFPPWPVYAQDEIDAVSEVLRSGQANYWVGEQGRLFEQEFAEYFGCGHAVAVANGTVALELALRSLGIGAGDEVIVPCRTFIATASSVAICGARPVMADIDPVSQTLTVETVDRALTSRTRAIIAVHLGGWPCEMDAIMSYASERGLKVIEDCAQAHGATYKDRFVGSFGDVAAFSFCHDKIMSAGGEGGMLVTSSRSIWEIAWSFKDHGKNNDAIHHSGQSATFRWLHDSFGTNWRMTEMQAAIGRIQLKKLSGWVEARRKHAAILSDHFSSIPGLRLTRTGDGIGHAYYKYYAFVRPELLHQGWSRDRVIDAINAEGVPCFQGCCSEIYREKAFENVGWVQERRFKAARQLGDTALMFLVHPTLSAEDMEDTKRAVTKVMHVAGRDTIE